MATCEARALHRNHLLTEWAAFVAQVLVAIAFELGDDLGRGLFAQHGTLQGVRNARLLVSFEAARHLWIEPAWQLFFLQSRHILGITITSAVTVQAANGVYVLGHVFVTLGLAIWVYFYRRQYFVVLRNVIILVNGLALVVYENFPVAPPRLTTGLIFNHHPFTFQDTVFGSQVIGARYNEFSAMPSVHMAWAMVVGATLVILARSPLVRALGALYPVLMLLAVVVTGNHYLVDVMGAVVTVLVATLLSFSIARWQGTRAWPRVVRRAVLGRG